ncbi:hypothetical protein Tco_1286857, partial [Tanacetum coccineum]
MIGNSGDKMPMLAIVDNVHGMAHASSIDNIDHLRIHGSMLLIYCAFAFFTGLRILAGSHTWIVVAAMPYVYLSTLWKVEGRQSAKELVAHIKATSTGAHRSWFNTRQVYYVSVKMSNRNVKKIQLWAAATTTGWPPAAMHISERACKQIRCPRSETSAERRVPFQYAHLGNCTYLCRHCETMSFAILLQGVPSDHPSVLATTLWVPLPRLCSSKLTPSAVAFIRVP